jgi:hypothetical protein
MSLVSNGAKFKRYTVLNGLLFPTPTQPRISFERAIFIKHQKNYIMEAHTITNERLCFLWLLL